MSSATSPLQQEKRSPPKSAKKLSPISNSESRLSQPIYGRKITIPDFHLAKVVKEEANIYSKQGAENLPFPDKLFLKPIHSELINGIFSRPLVLSILKNQFAELFEDDAATDLGAVETSRNSPNSRTGDAGGLISRNVLYVKAFDLVDSQEAGTTIDMGVYERFAKTLVVKLGVDVNRYFVPAQVEWWKDNLKRIIAVRHVGHGILRIKVSKAAIERYIIDVIEKLKPRTAVLTDTMASDGLTETVITSPRSAARLLAPLLLQSPPRSSTSSPLPMRTQIPHPLDSIESLGSMSDSIGYSSISAKMSELSISDAGANFDFSGYTKGHSTKKLLVSNTTIGNSNMLAGRSATTSIGVRRPKLQSTATQQGGRLSTAASASSAVSRGRGVGGGRSGDFRIIDLGDRVNMNTSSQSSPPHYSSSSSTSYLPSQQPRNSSERPSSFAAAGSPSRLSLSPSRFSAPEPFNEELSIMSAISSVEGLREATYVKSKQKRLKQMYHLLLKSANLSDGEDDAVEDQKEKLKLWPNSGDEEGSQGSLGMESLLTTSLGSSFGKYTTSGTMKNPSRSSPSRTHQRQRRPKTQAGPLAPVSLLTSKSKSPAKATRSSPLSKTQPLNRSSRIIMGGTLGGGGDSSNDIRSLRIKEESELVALSAILRARKYGLLGKRAKPLSSVEKALLSSPFAKPIDPSVVDDYDPNLDDDDPKEEEMAAVIESFHSTIYAMSAEAFRERGGHGARRNSSILSCTTVNSARSGGTLGSVNSRKFSRGGSPDLEGGRYRAGSVVGGGSEAGDSKPSTSSSTDRAGASSSSTAAISLNKPDIIILPPVVANRKIPRRNLSAIPSSSADEEEDDNGTNSGPGSPAKKALVDDAFSDVVENDEDTELVDDLPENVIDTATGVAGSSHSEERWQSFGLHSEALHPVGRDVFEEREMIDHDDDTRLDGGRWQQIEDDADDIGQELAGSSGHLDVGHDAFDDEGADPSEYEYLFTAEEEEPGAAAVAGVMGNADNGEEGLGLLVIQGSRIHIPISIADKEQGDDG